MAGGGPDLASAYLTDVRRTFRNYKTLGEKAIAQAPDAHLASELDANSNSITIVVKHLRGNLRSRFVEFLTSDGEKPARHRDTEFEADAPASRADVMRWWDEGWSAVLDAVDALTPDDLTRTITIRGEPFLVVEALNRSATHTAYHVGQIVYLARHFAGSGWRSLSIPKGQSGSAGGDFKTRGIART